jgi:hypothetical protein
LIGLSGAEVSPPPPGPSPHPLTPTTTSAATAAPTRRRVREPLILETTRLPPIL